MHYSSLLLVLIVWAWTDWIKNLSARNIIQAQHVTNKQKQLSVAIKQLEIETPDQFSHKSCSKFDFCSLFKMDGWIIQY